LIWLQEQRAWEARARQLQALVDAGIGVLETHKKLADTGVMPEADAKKRALEVITGMHFGYGGNDYLIVWGMSPEVPSLASGARTANPQPPGAPQIRSEEH